MTEDEILKTNEMFAQFMGYEGQRFANMYYIFTDSVFSASMLKTDYDVHKNWNWIMEIVSELNRWGVKITIKGDKCTYEYGKLENSIAYFNNPIRSVYEVLAIAVKLIQNKTQVKI